MTIFQIVALCLCGPLALMTFAQLIIAIFYKQANYEISQAAILTVSVVVILVSFLGVDV